MASCKKFSIVQGSTSPLLTGTLLDTEATTQEVLPVGTTVECKFTRRIASKQVSLTIASTVIDLTARTVTIDAWPAGSTDTAGSYAVEWHLTRGDNSRLEIYPGDDISITATTEVS